MGPPGCEEASSRLIVHQKFPILTKSPVMKLDFSTSSSLMEPASLHASVFGETDRLTDVLLCEPSQLEPVPCCSVTRESLRNGFDVSAAEARRQHGVLRDTLAAYGVRCHTLPPQPECPDQCFTRDAAVSTPWGLVGLNPAMPHRLREVDHLVDSLALRGIATSRRVTTGTIEGGDICIAREGLLILGTSGERTTLEGAEAFASPFRENGWDVLVHAFDPHFLHLDTMFCMLDPHHALGCVDVLDDDFLKTVSSFGIKVIPVSYKDSRRLGCNILSLDGRTILMGSGQEATAERTREAGFEVIELEISQFTACGGGIHCLTMPLRRQRR